MSKNFTYKITINNWIKHNGTLKKGHTHFMVSKRIFNDDKISKLKPIEFQLYLYCLSISADMMSNQFTISAQLVPKYMRISAQSLSNHLARLESFQLLTAEKNELFINRIEKKGKELRGDQKVKEPKEQKRQEPPPPLDQIWNETVTKLAKVQACGKSRLAKIKTRWKENPDPEFWRVVIKKLDDSDFCTGNNDRGWKASFDFLLNPETANKVLEGKYDSTQKPKSQEQNYYVDPVARIVRD